MKKLVKLVLLARILLANGFQQVPVHFKFGVSSAAYQIEGGWNASGKGESIWDHFTHTYPELVTDHSTGDVACDSYHLWRDDISIMKDINVDFYRFSISWPRLLPDGFANYISPDGVTYYNNLINELLKNKIEPVFGWWADPIFSTKGDYPEVMKKRIAVNSRLENFTRSRLPPLTKLEIGIIRGTADFLGLNHYHTWLISDHQYPKNDPPSFQKDKGTVGFQDPNWKPSPRIVPWGFRKLLNWIKKKYNNPLVYITENGIEDYTGTLKDDERVLFLKLYIGALLDAINKDGCNVKRYTVWSLMDNMEWDLGYSVKFGIYQVDFKSPNKTRIRKDSANFYKNIIINRYV